MMERFGTFHTMLLVVYDCGASYQGVTLNDQLIQGPDFTSSLIGVITRCQQEPVATMADVKAMFHQVKVPQEDADLLRFLWWPGGDMNKPSDDVLETTGTCLTLQ